MNGVKSVHHAGGALAKSIEKNMAAGLDPIGDFPEYTAFTDMEFVSETGYIAAQRWFQTFHKWHPDAYFILNTRNIKDWISSRLRHGDGNYLRRFEELYGLSQDEIIQQWPADWYRHHHEVTEYFSDCDGKFLIFDIDRDKPEAICDFLADDFSLDASFWGHIGISLDAQDSDNSQLKSGEIEALKEKAKGLLFERDRFKNAQKGIQKELETVVEENEQLLADLKREKQFPRTKIGSAIEYSDYLLHVALSKLPIAPATLRNRFERSATRRWRSRYSED